MKKIINSLLACGIFSCSTFLLNNPHETIEIMLTSEMAHFLDGQPFGINARVVKRMLQVRRSSKREQFGETIKSGAVEGHYLLRGTKYSVRALAHLESQYEINFYQKESEYLQDKQRYAQELKELETTYHAFKNELKTLLIQARAKFEQEIKPFEEIIRGAKPQMIVLIAESCQKRKRGDCFLLKWAESPDNQEMAYFHDQVTTFKALDQFYSDFINFLDDVMRSCPKAMAQFKKLLNEQQPHPRK